MLRRLDRTEHYLTPEEERLLLGIARETLDLWVCSGRRNEPGRYALTPALIAKHGAFVTLRAYGELRGCIGYTQNREPLAETVIVNTVNAATNDPRFNPVQPGELASISIEISALTPGDTPLTPFKRVCTLDEIAIGRDGLYLEVPPLRGGLLLPQVAVEHNWSANQFLTAVCQKAGYPDRTWENPEARLYRFSAQVFSERTANA